MLYLKFPGEASAALEIGGVAVAVIAGAALAVAGTALEVSWCC